MKLKKLICMALAMLMVLSAAALAETDDLQAQLDAANARVAELEALVALYQPYYEQQIVATFGDDGIIWREDALKEYEAAASAYAQYGMSIDAYADEIKADILENLVQEAVLDAKAAELGVGTTALKTSFKTVYGVPIYQYQKDLRLQKAQRLLRETTLPVSDVAAEVGYANPAKFSSAFKKRFGVSPTEYKKRQAESEEAE